jgi:hypothetical protein
MIDGMQAGPLVRKRCRALIWLVHAGWVIHDRYWVTVIDSVSIKNANRQI